MAIFQVSQGFYAFNAEARSRLKRRGYLGIKADCSNTFVLPSRKGPKVPMREANVEGGEYHGQLYRAAVASDRRSAEMTGQIWGNEARTLEPVLVRFVGWDGSGGFPGTGMVRYGSFPETCGKRSWSGQDCRGGPDRMVGARAVELGFVAGGAVDFGHYGKPRGWPRSATLPATRRSLRSRSESQRGAWANGRSLSPSSDRGYPSFVCLFVCERPGPFHKITDCQSIESGPRGGSNTPICSRDC